MKAVLQEKKWHILPFNKDIVSKLSKGLKIPAALAAVLANRDIQNVQNANNYLSKSLKNTYDPYIFKHIDKIVNRILSAVKKNELITVYGDYDVDGICSTAILYSTLKEIGAKCQYYLPCRDEGYGLNSKAIKKCSEQGTKLIITVDCGINNCAEIKFAGSIGIDIIVTDHHVPGKNLPECIGIMNPKLADSPYPYKDLAGVGIAYKLSEAIAKKFPGTDVTQHLDLVGLGTIADVVPLTGENHIFAFHGLEAIKNTKKIGLQYLKKKSGIEREVYAGQVAFRLAPRINAAGRLDTAEPAIKLLLTKDEKEAKEFSNVLDSNNKERQKLEKDVLDNAIEQIERTFNFNSDKIIVLDNNNWPKGVIGIVASRIVNRYYRPCILISVEEGMGRGSCRSINNFNILSALDACNEHLKEYGGHSHAAGLGIEEILIDSFRDKINQYAEMTINTDDLVPRLIIDSEISFNDITFNLIEQLDKLSPYGYGNPKPTFVSKGLELYREPKIVGDKHLKFWLKSQGRVFEAIGFDMSEYISLLDEFTNLDIVYNLHINNWKDKQIIQLHIQDIKLAV